MAGTGHATTFLGAAPAGFRAAPAVLHVAVLLAFLRTPFASVRTQLTELPGALTTARHHDGGGTANLGAFEVERDAAREHLDVLLVQTGGGAVFTLKRAFIARIDAATHGFVGHGGVSGSCNGLATTERATHMTSKRDTEARESDISREDSLFD